jgi:hypothetical protein
LTWNLRLPLSFWQRCHYRNKGHWRWKTNSSFHSALTSQTAQLKMLQQRALKMKNSSSHSVLTSRTAQLKMLQLKLCMCVYMYVCDSVCMYYSHDHIV